MGESDSRELHHVMQKQAAVDRLVTDARGAAKLLGIPTRPRPPYSRAVAYPLLVGRRCGPETQSNL